MRVLILQQAALPGQMLAPGVVVDVSEATAAWLIEAGAAQAAHEAQSEVTAGRPTQDGQDGAAAAQRQRRKAQE